MQSIGTVTRSPASCHVYSAQGMKDVSATGDLNAYLLLKVGNEVLKSPSCNKLGPLPHHYLWAVSPDSIFKP